MIAYTPYEQSAIDELDLAFASPFRTPVSALVHAVWRAGTGSRSPGLRRRAKRLSVLVKHAMAHVNDLAASTLQPRAVFKAFRRAGHRNVRTLEDVRRLELWEVDELADRIQAKYLGLGAALGVLAGAVGLRGMTADVPLVTVLALRAIDEYALYYGYDPAAPKERAYAVNVLAAALSPTSNMRSASIDELVAAGSSLLRSWRREKPVRAALPLAFQLAKSILRRALSQPRRRMVMKVASGLGSLVSAGTNAWLLFGVMRAARSAYRERRLG